MQVHGEMQLSATTRE